MKIRIQQTELVKNLALAITACETKSTIPTAGLVSLELISGTARLYATNLDFALQVDFPVEKFESPHMAPCLFNAKKVMDWVSKTTGNIVLDKISHDRIQLKASKSVCTVGLLSEAWLPKLPEIKGDVGEIDSVDLTTLLSDVSHSMGDSEGCRYDYRGIHLDYSGGKIGALAVDSVSRISYSEKPAQLSTKLSSTIAKKVVADISRICKGHKPGDLTIKISSSENGLFFQAGGILIYARTLNSKMPDWRKAVPAGGSIVSIDSQALLSAIDRVKGLADRSQRLDFVLKGQSLSMSSGQGLDTATEELACQYEGADYEGGINAEFLSEAVRATGSKEAQISVFPGTMQKRIIVRRPNCDQFISMIAEMSKTPI